MVDLLPSSPEWIKDSLHWRGKVLTGKFWHWCDEWDGLPTDETCSEFLCCNCFEEQYTEEIEGLKMNLRKRYENESDPIES
jgi:hypothetical protein